MHFKSLKDLTPKELVMYGIIGLVFGYGIGNFIAPILDGAFFGPIVRLIGDGVNVLGSICLIWALFKWIKNKSKKPQ